MASEWYVYVLLSESGSSYVGVTTEPQRRLEQHNGSRPGGAKSTRAGRPWALEKVWDGFTSRGEAQKAEYQVKKLKGKERLTWVKPI